jgi:hypothetical protein
VFARILPYIEQDALYQFVDLNAAATSQPGLIAQRIAQYMCPNELNDRMGSPPTYPASYAVALGDWFTENYNTGQFGNGAFPGVSQPSERGLRLIDITDGTSTTIGFAEVKTFTSYLVLSSNLANPAMPATPGDLLALGGTFVKGTAHTAWANGAGFQTGFTFVFAPNTAVNYVNPGDGQNYDVDWIAGNMISYGALTSRSYHAGGVDAALMDGSVRFIANTIDPKTWHALGTRNGGEPVGDF